MADQPGQVVVPTGAAEQLRQAREDEIRRFLALSATEKFRLLMAAIEFVRSATVRERDDSRRSTD